MEISGEGLALIKQREGVVNHIYRDSKGLLTGGVGHLLTPEERNDLPLNTKISNVRVDQWLKQDLAKCEHAIFDLIDVPLKQNEYDALVSFIFNIGVKGFAGSTALRELNKGNKVKAGNAMLLWNLPPEIQKRRKAESNQFLGL